MSWASTIPKELTTHHTPLVILTGLDVKHNAIHKEIWDGFNARTNLKFRYKLLDGDHEYPKPKTKVLYLLFGCLAMILFYKLFLILQREPLSFTFLKVS